MEIKYSKKNLKISDKLMRKVAQYNTQAFEQLYNESSGAVFGLAMSIVGNSEDAKDVVQNTFISVYQKIQSYQPNGKAMAWIFTIARNHAYMILRERKKFSHVNLDDVYDIGDDTTVVEDMHKEKLTSVLLDELQDDEREIVVMHAMSNMKHKDIAQIMDIPLSTVISKYRRSLQKLRSIMEVNGYER